MNNNNTSDSTIPDTTEQCDADSYVLFGYSFVPLSPHKKKDFEKWDMNMELSEIASVPTQRVFGTKGYSSVGDDYISIVIDLEKEIQIKNTIETDLEALLSSFLESHPNIPSSKFIW
eukprot:CAMPEP_0168540944 /NCGR_PEP_ID=MMETSP0413-20121227/551_1 /TAXON_ID=136452 /ORGANISM="Filamoeba nolandi, Strain NC-AS-23-1" /LENGTH=116 /DNA_ID=CAMNT_0008570721 /DNA_START=191 /DNA_END=538 /DNA_ORIENTATION=+